jgi:hypothetical protein
MNQYEREMSINQKIANSPEYRKCMGHYQEMITAFFSQKGILFRYHAYKFLNAVKELPLEEPGNEIRTEFMLSYEKFKQMARKKASPSDKLFSPEKLLHRPDGYKS